VTLEITPHQGEVLGIVLNGFDGFAPSVHRCVLSEIMQIDRVSVSGTAGHDSMVTISRVTWP
jgi:hypothetical protein